MKRLIINGDDFGMCEGVSLGILKAYKHGILRSTTMMVNMPYARGAATLAKECPDLGVGLHLTLTIGRPILNPKEVPTLVDENGNFLSHDWHLKNANSSNDQLNYEEIYKEFQAQMERFIELNSKLPTHIDSHHFISSLPRIHECTKKLIQKYDLPTRFDESWVYSDYEKPTFSKKFYANNVDTHFFTDNQEHLFDHELVEIMTHPAFVDQYLLENSSYNIARTKELDVLCQDKVKQWIKENEIELINFTQLNKII